MATIVALRHDTRYQYREPVRLGPQTIRLRPGAPGRTEIRSYSLEIGPNPATLRWQQDLLGNLQGHAMVQGEVRTLDIRVRLVAALVPYNPFDFVMDVGVAEWPFRYPEGMERALMPFLTPLPNDGLLDALAAAVATGPGDTLGLLTRCNAAVHDRVAYVVRLAHGVQDPGATLSLGHGSCRDSAWLQVNLMRRLGIAARFCSGYLVEPETEQHGDRADLHAWTEVWLPGAGWIGLDATSGLFCAEGHILLAAGPDPGFCAPISGSHTAAEAELSFSLHLERLEPEHRTPATFPRNG